MENCIFFLKKRLQVSKKKEKRKKKDSCKKKKKNFRIKEKREKVRADRTLSLFSLKNKKFINFL